MGLPASIAVTITEVVQDNWQRTVRYRCKVVFGNGLYPNGGIPLVAALNAALLPTTNNKMPRLITAQSLIGSGLTYDYIRASGTLMVLVVPPSGSLSSGTRLEQINSDQMNLIAADQIVMTVEYDRNAGS